MWKLFKANIAPEITSAIPPTTLELSDGKKVEVVLSLMNTFRHQINTCNERAFKTVH